MLGMMAKTKAAEDPRWYFASINWLSVHAPELPQGTPSTTSCSSYVTSIAISSVIDPEVSVGDALRNEMDCYPPSRFGC